MKMSLGANPLYDDSTRFTATAASHARGGANAHRVSAAALPGGPRRRSSAAAPAATGRVTERRTKDRSALQNGSADLINVALIPGIAHRWRTPVLSTP